MIPKSDTNVSKSDKCSNCKPILKIPRNKDFLCGGLLKKGTRYRKDKIKLCLKGKHVPKGYIFLEMTQMEACLIASILSACASHFASH